MNPSVRYSTWIVVIRDGAGGTLHRLEFPHREGARPPMERAFKWAREEIRRIIEGDSSLVFRFTPRSIRLFAREYPNSTSEYMDIPWEES